MDENENQDLVVVLLAAIDNLQIARNGPVKQEEDAFQAVLLIRGDIEEAYYA